MEGPTSSHHNENVDDFFSSGDVYRPNTDGVKKPEVVMFYFIFFLHSLAFKFKIIGLLLSL